MVRILVLLALIISFLTTSSVHAQVSPADSMALVDFYQSTNGNGWKKKNNWLIGKVSTWYGVTVVSGTVYKIDLPNNLLTGPFPSSFCSLSNLAYVYLSDNRLSGTLPPCFGTMLSLNSFDVRNNFLSGDIPTNFQNFPLLADLFISNNSFSQLPDLSALPEFSNLLVQNNQLSFEDLEYNRTVANFQYAPQDSLYYSLDTIGTIKDTVTFYCLVGGSANSYQWSKDGVLLTNDSHFSGCTSPILTINKLTTTDKGNYTCRITNSLVSNLTLYRKKIHLSINDTRLPQTISLPIPPKLLCGDGPFKINASNSTSLTLSYSLVSGDAQLISDTIFPLHNGVVSIRISNDGDDTYQPTSKDTSFHFYSFDPTLTPSLKQIPTDVGKPLSLVFTKNNAYTYRWITPNSDTINSNAVTIASVTAADEGIYRGAIGRNGCDFFTEQVLVSFKNLHTLQVFELVTPNNDGKNDSFEISTIEKYPDNSVQVFNVSNQEVFHKTNYANDWSGENQPSGTYYYIVKIPSQNIVLKGIVYLKK